MVIDENAEVLFQSLICTFRLSIGLRVIGGADVLCDSQGTAEFSGECGCETGISVGNDACGKSVMWKYVSSVKFGGVFGISGFIAGNENRCFREGVRDCKYGIVRFRRGKFDDEVHGYRSEWCIVSV